MFVAQSVTARRQSSSEGYPRCRQSPPRTQSENLQLVDADLMKEDGWLEACRGIDVVIHVASVFKLGLSEEAVVAPAVTGTRNVMTAAADAGVRRVIVTSSIAAIYGGHPLTT